MAGDGAEPFHSYTIMTGPAAASIDYIHPRMPLVLPASAWQDWLDADTPEERIADCLMAPENDFEAYPISTRVNNHRHEGTEHIEPVTPPKALYPISRVC